MDRRHPARSHSPRLPSVRPRAIQTSTLPRCERQRRFTRDFDARRPACSLATGRTGILFTRRPCRPDHPVPRRSIALVGEREILGGLGEEAYQRCDGPTHWASLSLTPETFTEMARALIGTDLQAPVSRRLLAPPPAPMQRLSWLHGQVARLARETAWVLASEEPARALEQVMGCLAKEGPKVDAAARRRGAAIVARLEATLEAAPGRPLHLPEICMGSASRSGPCRGTAWLISALVRNVTFTYAVCIWRAGYGARPNPAPRNNRLA
jgi:hypothetical protein